MRPSRRARRLLWCLLPIFLGYVALRGSWRGNDFKYPYNAARALWYGGRLDVRIQPRYPVSFHVLLSPLASLPIGVAAAIWAVLSIAALARLPAILERLTGLPPRRQALGWVVVLPSLCDAVVLGQSDPINLFLVSAGLLAVKEGHPLAGTCAVGLAGMIKLLPIVFWSTILSRCRSRGVWAGMALSVAFGVGLIVAVVGWHGAAEGIREQVTWLRDHEKPWHLIARQSDLRANNESLPIVLARTFGNIEMQRPPHAVTIGRAPLERIWAVWAMLLALMAVAWLASIGPARAASTSRGWLAMFALTAILMLAASPICWHHYFLWILPAALFLIHRRRLLIVAAGFSLVSTAVPSARWLGCHMLLALGLFAVVVHDLRRRVPVREDQ